MALHLVNRSGGCIHCGLGGGNKATNYMCSECSHWVHKKCEKTHNEQFKHPKEDNE